MFNHSEGEYGRALHFDTYDALRVYYSTVSPNWGERNGNFAVVLDLDANCHSEEQQTAMLNYINQCGESLRGLFRENRAADLALEVYVSTLRQMKNHSSYRGKTFMECFSNQLLGHAHSDLPEIDDVIRKADRCAHLGITVENIIIGEDDRLEINHDDLRPRQ
jgi:hypothetical protein